MHNPWHYRSNGSLQNIVLNMLKFFFFKFPLLKEIKQHLNRDLLSLDCILECCVVKKHSNKTRITVSDCMAIGCPSFVIWRNFLDRKYDSPISEAYNQVHKEWAYCRHQYHISWWMSFNKCAFQNISTQISEAVPGMWHLSQELMTPQKINIFGNLHLRCSWKLPKTPSTQWWGIHFQRCLFSCEHLQEWKNLLKIGCTNTSVWHDSAHHQH